MLPVNFSATSVSICIATAGLVAALYVLSDQTRTKKRIRDLEVARNGQLSETNIQQIVGEQVQKALEPVAQVLENSTNAFIAKLQEMHKRIEDLGKRIEIPDTRSVRNSRRLDSHERRASSKAERSSLKKESLQLPVEEERDKEEDADEEDAKEEELIRQFYASKNANRTKGSKPDPRIETDQETDIDNEYSEDVYWKQNQDITNDDDDDVDDDVDDGKEDEEEEEGEVAPKSLVADLMANVFG